MRKKRRLDTYQNGVLVLYTDEDNWKKDWEKYDKIITSAACQYFFIHSEHWESTRYRLFKRPLRMPDEPNIMTDLGLDVVQTWVNMTGGDFVALAMRLSE